MILGHLVSRNIDSSYVCITGGRQKSSVFFYQLNDAVSQEGIVQFAVKADQTR